MTVLDDNEKLLINEVLEVLIGVGIFTGTRSFNTKSFQFVTMNEFKSLCQEVYNFLLGSSIQCLFSVEIRNYFIHCNVCRKMGQMCLSIVEECFSVKVTHNLCVT